MLRIGYHVSAAGGYTAMVRRATALGANTSAWMRTMSQASKASRHIRFTASVINPWPQKSRPSQ